MIDKKLFDTFEDIRELIDFDYWVKKNKRVGTFEMGNPKYIKCIICGDIINREKDDDYKIYYYSIRNFFAFHPKCIENKIEDKIINAYTEASLNRIHKSNKVYVLIREPYYKYVSDDFKERCNFEFIELRKRGFPAKDLIRIEFGGVM